MKLQIEEIEMSEKVTTPVGRVSYPFVFNAQRNDLSGKDEFSVVLVFGPDTDLSKLKAVAQAALVEKWGADQKKWPPNLRSPFRRCEDRAKDGVLPEGYPEGGVFLTLKSQLVPGIVDADLQPIIESRDFYAGCDARATVSPYTYEKQGNRGVSFGLRNLQKTADGDPISGRTAPEDDFEPVAANKAQGNAAATSIFD
jgi:hypothetical protein